MVNFALQVNGEFWIKLEEAVKFPSFGGVAKFSERKF